MDSSSQKNHSLKSVVLAVRTGLAALAEAKPGAERDHIASLLRRDSVTLAEQAWKQHLWLWAADDWLTAHPDAPDYRQREDQWLLKVRQYTVAMTLLGEVLTALQDMPEMTEQAAMSMGDISPKQLAHWEV